MATTSQPRVDVAATPNEATGPVTGAATLEHALSLLTGALAAAERTAPGVSTRLTALDHLAVLTGFASTAGLGSLSRKISICDPSMVFTMVETMKGLAPLSVPVAPAVVKQQSRKAKPTVNKSSKKKKDAPVDRAGGQTGTSKKASKGKKKQSAKAKAADNSDLKEKSQPKQKQTPKAKVPKPKGKGKTKAEEGAGEPAVASPSKVEPSGSSSDPSTSKDGQTDQAPVSAPVKTGKKVSATKAAAERPLVALATFKSQPAESSADLESQPVEATASTLSELEQRIVQNGRKLLLTTAKRTYFSWVSTRMRTKGLVMQRPSSAAEWQELAQALSDPNMLRDLKELPKERWDNESDEQWASYLNDERKALFDTIEPPGYNDIVERVKSVDDASILGRDKTVPVLFWLGLIAPTGQHQLLLEVLKAYSEQRVVASAKKQDEPKVSLEELPKVPRRKAGKARVTKPQDEPEVTGEQNSAKPVQNTEAVVGESTKSKGKKPEDAEKKRVKAERRDLGVTSAAALPISGSTAKPKVSLSPASTVRPLPTSVQVGDQISVPEPLRVIHTEGEEKEESLSKRLVLNNLTLDSLYRATDPRFTDSIRKSVADRMEFERVAWIITKHECGEHMSHEDATYPRPWENLIPYNSDPEGGVMRFYKEHSKNVQEILGHVPLVQLGMVHYHLTSAETGMVAASESVPLLFSTANPVSAVSESAPEPFPKLGGESGGGTRVISEVLPPREKRPSFSDKVKLPPSPGRPPVAARTLASPVKGVTQDVSGLSRPWKFFSPAWDGESFAVQLLTTEHEDDFFPKKRGVKFSDWRIHVSRAISNCLSRAQAEVLRKDAFSAEARKALNHQQITVGKCNLEFGGTIFRVMAPDCDEGLYCLPTTNVEMQSDPASGSGHWLYFVRGTEATLRRRLGKKLLGRDADLWPVSSLAAEIRMGLPAVSFVR